MTGKRYTAPIRNGISLAIQDTDRASGTGLKYYGRNAEGDYYQYQGQNNRYIGVARFDKERVPMWICSKALQPVEPDE